MFESFGHEGWLQGVYAMVDLYGSNFAHYSLLLLIFEALLETYQKGDYGLRMYRFPVYLPFPNQTYKWPVAIVNIISFENVKKTHSFEFWSHKFIISSCCFGLWKSTASVFNSGYSRIYYRRGLIEKVSLLLPSAVLFKVLKIKKP